MYETGQLIIYGGEGVCRVEGICQAPLPGLDQSRTYYKLSSYYHSGIIYAPTDVAVPMRPVLTEEEAWALIRQIPQMEVDDTSLGDAKHAAAAYKALLQTYEYTNLLKLIRMIYARNRQAISQGKSYGHIDERFFKRAKELLHGELAVALGLSPAQVEGAIICSLDGQEH